MCLFGFRSAKSPTDYMPGAKLPKLEEDGRCESFGQKNTFACDSKSTITTFTTEAYQELLNIQKRPLNYKSRKMLFL